MSEMPEGSSTVGSSTESVSQRTVSVVLFKDSGKYYASESWRAPVNEGYLDPSQMVDSPDFRRIGEGKILILSEPHNHAPYDENWGYPTLI